MSTTAILPNSSSTSGATSATGLENLHQTTPLIKLPHTEIETYKLYSSTEKIVALSLVYGLLSIIALAGHIMVFIVVIFNRTMHTATNVLLLNLSVSDILFVSITVPGFLSLEICNGRLIFSELVGKFGQQAIILCAASSAFTMMAIAFERFLAVVYPLKQMARKKAKSVAIAMVIIWVCAIGLSIPMGYYWTTFTFTAPTNRDGEVVLEEISFLIPTMTKVQGKAYHTSVFICLHVVPIIFLSYFYARVVWKLWNPDKQLAQDAAATSSIQPNAKNFVKKIRRKTTIMLLTVVLVFFICQFPFSLFYLVVTYRGTDGLDDDIRLNARIVVRILILFNSASNPIIYNFLSQKFRTGFKHIFSCHCLRPKRNNHIQAA